MKWSLAKSRATCQTICLQIIWNQRVASEKHETRTTSDGGKLPTQKWQIKICFAFYLFTSSFVVLSISLLSFALQSTESTVPVTAGDDWVHTKRCLLTLCRSIECSILNGVYLINGLAKINLEIFETFFFIFSFFNKPGKALQEFRMILT